MKASVTKDHPGINSLSYLNQALSKLFADLPEAMLTSSSPPAPLYLSVAPTRGQDGGDGGGHLAHVLHLGHHNFLL